MNFNIFFQNLWIVDTYANRIDVPKFAHVADIQKEIIEQNDYNLNIPRYVDTAEIEQEIDLDKVAMDICNIDSEISEVTSKLRKSLDELGVILYL